jgi:hypothetical protein
VSYKNESAVGVDELESEVIIKIIIKKKYLSKLKANVHSISYYYA